MKCYLIYICNYHVKRFLLFSGILIKGNVVLTMIFLPWYIHLGVIKKTKINLTSKYAVQLAQDIPTSLFVIHGQFSEKCSWGIHQQHWLKKFCDSIFFMWHCVNLILMNYLSEVHKFCLLSVYDQSSFPVLFHILVITSVDVVPICLLTLN